ncbi:hypothetical protein DNK47_00695 [Mycoplasma wenyonii]|uniref:Uncharacterized protein n=1 Tax=Mycoplasma wenyonii TaxID=65123 RepID=A0A328PJP5_9MOLU|nr:hypothetical protein [Mycoplasma wenyonii]RAO95353.1 hypothetical protein DNK47_00695 [Mycoplasma wenyonii]
MFVSGGALQANKVGFGCLVLLGSVSVAGIAELEIQKQLLSTWGKSIGEWFSERLSNSSQQTQEAGSPVTFSQIAFPFTYVWGQVSGPVGQALPYVQSGFEQIKSSFGDLWGALKSFLKSLFEPEIFNNIFKDLHLRIWRVLVFAFAGGKGRDSFLDLFSEEKKEATKIATKFLLGMEQKGSKYFKADKKVFSFLLMQWMFNPKKITEKFERLSKTIQNLVKRAETHETGGSSSSSEESQSPTHTYTLTVPTVKQYLDVEEGLPEILFNLMWMGEVASKIKTGHDLTMESKSWVSWFFKSS